MTISSPSGPDVGVRTASVRDCHQRVRRIDPSAQRARAMVRSTSPPSNSRVRPLISSPSAPERPRTVKRRRPRRPRSPAIRVVVFGVVDSSAAPTSGSAACRARMSAPLAPSRADTARTWNTRKRLRRHPPGARPGPQRPTLLRAAHGLESAPRISFSPSITRATSSGGTAPAFSRSGAPRRADLADLDPRRLGKLRDPPPGQRTPTPEAGVRQRHRDHRARALVGASALRCGQAAARLLVPARRVRSAQRVLAPRDRLRHLRPAPLHRLPRRMPARSPGPACALLRKAPATRSDELLVQGFLDGFGCDHREAVARTPACRSCRSVSSSIVMAIFARPMIHLRV